MKIRFRLNCNNYIDYGLGFIFLILAHYKQYMTDTQKLVLYIATTIVAILWFSYTFLYIEKSNK